RPASKPRDQAAANTRSRPAPLDQAGRRRRAPRPPLLTACKDRVSFTLRRKPAGRGRRDRPVIGRGQLTPKNDAVCPPFKRQEPRYLTSDPHRDPDGRFQKSGKGGLGSRATASKIPVILAVLDGNLVCSYNVYYWHIFNNHPNYGCKSLEYSQNFRSITVSGLPYLMKNPHFD